MDMYPYVVCNVVFYCRANRFLMFYIFVSSLNGDATHHNEDLPVGEDSNDSNRVALTGCRNDLSKQVTIVIKIISSESAVNTLINDI